MNDRIPLDDMTSDQLDALYAERDQLRRERDRIRLYRAWLATVVAKAQDADRATQCPDELRISPHNGLAAGAETALHGLNRILNSQQAALDQPEPCAGSGCTHEQAAAALTAHDQTSGHYPTAEQQP